ncbi:MAG: TetR/AcrR family transcriptional regulator [Candidatus Syntrophonatronum acetioxidans]|uniref:TetR/AcrR family transcriptional regulator n=1 Tax=Candidatus Syntrophonatronum acetioxidans TaxID=1795816 RepID=A0A424YAT1_9FIRM|nr:MAG: TetR/AcrR family transcriptional regulator [Candidatus Syntrophonatronum acetioxidans]
MVCKVKGVKKVDKLAKGSDTKQEFLRTALELFHEKGYEKATIQDIIDKMGVSKGAFYHYFESKEDVIEKIAKEYADWGISIMRKIADRKDLNAIEKINAIVENVNQYKSSREEDRTKMKGLFNGDKNLKLERKIANEIRQDALAIYEEILGAGVDEGLIEKVNTRELAEFTANTINSLNDSIDQLIEECGADRGDFCSEEFIERLEEKLIFYEEAFARIYKLKGRPIKLKEAFLRRFVKVNK